MVTRTSLSAMRALMYLARSEQPVLPPRLIADALGESPSYLAKILGRLAKARILHGIKGGKGGVRLNRPPDQVSLLAIVEACQGSIVGNYCRGACDPDETCSYHKAMLELQSDIVNVLSSWNLAHLIRHPQPRTRRRGQPVCLLDWGAEPAAVNRIYLKRQVRG